MWLKITDLNPEMWPTTGNWIITWAPGLGWTWTRRDEDEAQARLSDVGVTAMMRRFRAGLARKREISP